MERIEREARWVHPLPPSYTEQKAAHIRLVKGVTTYNPHLQVLCSTLAKGSECRKGSDGYRKALWYRPRLLVKNCGDPDLQLWICQGCEDKFLLRVKIEDSTRAQVYVDMVLS